MERLLKRRRFAAITGLLLTICCRLPLAAQIVVPTAITLPPVNDSLINLGSYITQPFLFAGTTIEVVDLFTGLAATHCKDQPGDCGILPVYLLEFDGRRQNSEQALLNWKTTNEINSKGFDVERSLGDIQKFMFRGFVASQQGATYQEKYNFKDANNYAGTSYYRLRQIDNDGQFTYSGIVAVKGFGMQESLQAYPSPAKSMVTLRINVLKASGATLLVTDATGKTIIRKAISLFAGNNNSTLAVTGLKAGVYNIQLVRTNAAPLRNNLVKQ
ncbi:T9SS type A sorting domain-containing protein [Foetidibacter luteolus]|uniref:T9SS type A sorting domain-containing protein n=1 Tax=Foetidibacter luteolus TaxID=2608880 RepID=UPI00129A381C|nr:T9SS type A sorting domain-containing protein [Foetidibacter luteolus]